MKPAVLLDVGIDLFSQVLEVRCFQPADRGYDQNTFIFEQFTLDHLLTPNLYQPTFAEF